MIFVLTAFDNSVMFSELAGYLLLYRMSIALDMKFRHFMSNPVELNATRVNLSLN